MCPAPGSRQPGAVPFAGMLSPNEPSARMRGRFAVDDNRKPGGIAAGSFIVGSGPDAYSFAFTVTPSTCGIVFGAPMAAPMIIGKGTGAAGAAVIVRLFGSSR